MSELIRERFAEPADGFAAGFVASVEEDARLVEHDIRGSIAHARMLGARAILSEAHAAAIVGGLERILAEWRSGEFRLRAADEDVHMNVERRLIEILGPAGARLHTARSRNDQVSLDLRLWTRESGHDLLAGIATLRRALLARAGECADVVLPGTTHLQHAQPVVLGHVFLCYHDRLARDAGRMEDALRRADVSPLGAGALAGSSLPVDPAATARELGFAAPFANSLDAVSDRDDAVEFVSAAALLMTHLSQMAEDFVLWSTPEFGYIELPDALCTGSSLMPQKKNPDMLELVRGKAAVVLGQLVTLLATLKALPLGYNRDLQLTKPAVFEAADSARDSLQAMTLAVSRMKVNAERMAAAAAGDPGLLATDLAEYLTARGVPFREAHAAVARLMKAAAARGASPLDLPLGELRTFAPEFGEDIFARLTPRASVEAKTSPGGTAPALVRKRVEAALKQSPGDR